MSGDPYFSNVQLQLSFDGSYADASNAGHVVYPSYTGSRSPDAKFGSYSLDTSWNSACAAATPSGTHSELAIGTQPFTIEVWAKLVAPFPNTNTSMGLIGKWQNPYEWFFSWDNRGYGLAFYVNGSDFTPKSSYYTPDCQWHHYCVERDVSNTLRIYVDGVIKGTFASFTDSINNNSSPIVLGANGGQPNFNGFIDSARVTIGVARYGGAFTPPTTDFPVGSANDTNWSKVVYLVNFETGLVDLSSYARTVTYTPTPATSSQVTLSTTLYEAGTGSADFGSVTLGSNCVRMNGALNIGTQPFTIECWARINGTWPSGDGVSHTLISQWNQALNWNLCIDNKSASGFAFYQTGSFNYKSSFAYPTDNNWHHYCAERSSNGDTRLYVDGAVVALFSAQTFTLAGTELLTIGNDGENKPTLNWPGQIDEVRVTVGVARYNGAFTPPRNYNYASVTVTAYQVMLLG